MKWIALICAFGALAAVTGCSDPEPSYGADYDRSHTRFPRPTEPTFENVGELAEQLEEAGVASVWLDAWHREHLLDLNYRTSDPQEIAAMIEAMRGSKTEPVWHKGFDPHLRFTLDDGSERSLVLGGEAQIVFDEEFQAWLDDLYAKAEAQFASVFVRQSEAMQGIEAEDVALIRITHNDPPGAAFVIEDRDEIADAVAQIAASDSYYWNETTERTGFEPEWSNVAELIGQDGEVLHALAWISKMYFPDVLETEDLAELLWSWRDRSLALAEEASELE